VVFDTIDSTNTYLLENPSLLPPAVCIANQQTGGRGRLGRHWCSPKSGGLYLSLLWKLRPHVLAVPLTLIIGVAVVQALQDYDKHLASAQFTLKWPNDVLWDGKKLGGILTESQSGQPYRCVIGIGLNSTLPSTIEIPKAHTDITQILSQITSHAPKHVDRNRLTSLLLTELITLLTKLNQSPRAAHIQSAHYLQQWEQMDALKGKMVYATANDNTVFGCAQGVTPKGDLIIKQPDGDVAYVNAGEATLTSYYNRN